MMANSVNVKVLNDFDRELVKVVAAVLVNPDTGAPYASDGSSVPAIVSGSLSALNATLPLNVPDNLNTCIMQITGVGVGTYVFEGSVDGITWTTLSFSAAQNIGSGADSVSATGVGIVYINASVPYIRIRLSAYTSGTFTFSWAFRQTNPATRSVYIGAGSIGISSITAGVVVGAGVGMSTSNSNALSSVSRLAASLANTNANLVKSSAGKIAAITAYNASTSVRYLRIYNKATAPAPGTDTAALVFAIGPSQQFQFNLADIGYYCSSGIGYAITAGNAANDATAVAAGDIVGLNIIYV